MQETVVVFMSNGKVVGVETTGARDIPVEVVDITTEERQSMNTGICVMDVDTFDEWVETLSYMYRTIS